MLDCVQKNYLVLILIFILLIAGCVREKDKRGSIESGDPSVYGWFIKHRNISPDGMKLNFTDKNVNISFPSYWKIVESTDSVYVFRNNKGEDEKSFLAAIVLSNRDLQNDAFSYFLSSFDELKAEYRMDEIKTKFFYIESINNLSILFGEVTIGNHTLKTCIVNDSTNLFDFVMSYPTALFVDSIDVDYSKFLNSFRWNGRRVVPPFDSCELIEVEIK